MRAPNFQVQPINGSAMASQSRAGGSASLPALLPAAYSGNQAALRRLSRTPQRLQRKLEIGAVDDPLETEADRAADHVMRMPAPPPSDTGEWKK